MLMLDDLIAELQQQRHYHGNMRVAIGIDANCSTINDEPAEATLSDVHMPTHETFDGKRILVLVAAEEFAVVRPDQSVEPIDS